MSSIRSFTFAAIVGSAALLFAVNRAGAEDKFASNSSEVESAVSSAVPGDVINISSGAYFFRDALVTPVSGSTLAPIIVRGISPGTTRLDFDDPNGFVIGHTNWQLENLWINGACADPVDCQDGVTVNPEGDNFAMRNCRLSNWSQLFKSSRTSSRAAGNGLLSGNEFYNDTPLMGSAVALVGATNWTIRNNYVHDFGGDLGAGDYGISVKGASRDNVLERNLIICSKDRPNFGVEVGLSFGSGRTSAIDCPGGACDCEDTDSIARNNIIMNCSDAALHANAACGSRYLNNLAYDSGAGFQIQTDSVGDPIDIQNNVMTGVIFGGVAFTSTNNITNFDTFSAAAVYRDPPSVDFREGADTSLLRDEGVDIYEVPNDYCDNPRDDVTTDIGPIEFPTTCVVFPWSTSGTPIPIDAGAPDAGDSDGGAPQDGGPPTDGGGNDDTGVLEDAGGQTDSGAEVDSGDTPDAGGPVQDTGFPQTDTGAPPLSDAGSTDSLDASVTDRGPKLDDGGNACGCTSIERRRPSPNHRRFASVALLLVLGVGASVRRLCRRRVV